MRLRAFLLVLPLLLLSIGVKCGKSETNWAETTVFVDGKGVYNRYLASTKSYLIVPPDSFSSPVHVYVKDLPLPSVWPKKSSRGFYYEPVGYYEVVGVEGGVKVNKGFYLRVPCGDLPEKYGEVHVFSISGGKWELVGKGFVEESGYVAFSMPDFGEFLVLIESKPAEFWVEEKGERGPVLPASGGVVKTGDLEFFVPVGAVDRDVPIDVVPQDEISIPKGEEEGEGEEVVLKLGIVPVGVKELSLKLPLLVAYSFKGLKKYEKGEFELCEVEGGKLTRLGEAVGYDPVTGYVFFEIRHMSLYVVLFSHISES